MDKLAIPVATFYWCGSGGGTVLAVITNHPTRVCSAIVHEVPFGTIPELDALPSLCRHVVSSVMNEDVASYDVLGPEYQPRLDKTLFRG
jgi:hypothetical protein